MRVTVRRQPTTLERLLGRRRARRLRRRLGLVALGAGVSLLRPRPAWAPLAAGAATVTALAVVVAAQL